MIKKRLSLEDIEDKKDDKLLIDILIEKTKKEEETVSLTADILKQREELKKKLLEELNDQDKEVKDEVEGNNDSDKDDSDESDSGSGTLSDLSDSDRSDEEKSVESKDEENEDEEKTEDEEKDSKEDDSVTFDSDEEDEEDISSAADDKEKLKSIIGSGYKSSSEKEKEKEPEKEKSSKPATEAYTSSINDPFKPILDIYNRYLISLESINPNLKPQVKPENQPIAYTKDAVIKALNNLIRLANSYITKNKDFIDTVSQSVKRINEKVVLYTTYVQEEKYQFNMKVVNDKDIIALVATNQSSDLRDNVRLLSSYITDSSKLGVKILNNSFEELKSIFQTNNFKETEDPLVYEYKSMIPGFNLIKVQLDTYFNYLKVKVNEFNFYRVKMLKTEDLYNLPSITLDNDNDIKYIVNILNELVVSISMMIDNLNLINQKFSEFIDSIKVLIYDVENNKYSNLAELNIDDKIKDFIKFKLSMEVFITDINLIVEFFTGCESVLQETVDF